MGARTQSEQLEQIRASVWKWARDPDVRRWLRQQWRRFERWCATWLERDRADEDGAYEHPASRDWRGVASLPRHERVALAAGIIVGLHDAGALDPIVPQRPESERVGKDDDGSGVARLVRAVMHEVQMPLRGPHTGSDGSVDPAELPPSTARQYFEMLKAEYSAVLRRRQNRSRRRKGEAKRNAANPPQTSTRAADPPPRVTEEVLRVASAPPVQNGSAKAPAALDPQSLVISEDTKLDGWTKNELCGQAKIGSKVFNQICARAGINRPQRGQHGHRFGGDELRRLIAAAGSAPGKRKWLPAAELWEQYLKPPSAT